MNQALKLTCLFMPLSVFVGCNSSSNMHQQSSTEVTFSEVGSDIMPFEDRNRRKWDNAVIADLDQDGLTDVVTTDHGSSINIYWNLGGQFSQPQTILKKDTHGVTASDFDNDGKVEIIVAQGGGNGKKPKYPILFEVSKNRKVTRSDPYTYFEFTRGRAAKFIDANNDGKLELIQTGFPLPAQTDGANFLYKLDRDNQYQYVANLPQAKWLGYRLTTADFNQDGDQDLVFYGGTDTIILQGENGYDYKDVTLSAFGDLAKTSHISSMSPFDFDNDGDLDILVTRAKPQFTRQTFYDEDNKRFAFFTFKETYQFPDMKIKGDLIVNNLQQAHPDFDVFIGASKEKLTYEVDLHGHKDFTLSPQQANGWPKNVEDKGIYLGYLGNDTWRLLVNTRSRSAGVINNVIEPLVVGDLDMLPVKLFENQNGSFSDVSKQMGLDIKEQTISSITADFNNDGWSDVFIVKYGDMAATNEQLLYLNKQGQGFELQPNHNIVSQEIGSTGSGAEAIDYDMDGDVDIVYANERGKWHLFNNNLENNNQYLSVHVNKSPNKGTSFLNAKVTVEACGLIQTKYVGYSSAPYSQNSNQYVSFGLGDCDESKLVTVYWQNNDIQTQNVPAEVKMINMGE